MAGTDGTAQAVNALAQVYWIAAHYKAVAFIQVEHDFFEDKGRNFLKIEKHGGFRMVTLLPSPIRKKGERTICYVPLANKTNGSCLALARHDTRPYA